MCGFSGRVVVLLVLGACRLRFDPSSELDAQPGGDSGDPLGDATAETATFAVGTFVKLDAVGTQTFAHDLGTTPKAIVLWTSGHATVGFSTSTHFALGFTDQDGTSRSLGIAIQDNVARVSDRRISTGAITILGDNAATVAEATITARDATTLTLDWTANNGRAEQIHYLLIGGPVSSRVVPWTMPSTTGPIAVDGSGFQPDVVLHAHAMAGMTAAPPANLTQAGFGLGAMTAVGQWSAAVFTSDGTGPTNTQRGARTVSCVEAFDADELVIRRASFTAMDAAGFRLDFDVVGGAGTQAFSLALAGVQAHAGTFDKPIGQTSAQVPGVGFRSAAVLLASTQDLARTTPVPHARFGFGAATTSFGVATAFSDTDGLAVASVDSVTRVGAAFTKLDNDTATIDAELGLPTFDASGFTLPVTINDAVATQIHYLALGAR